MEKVSCPLQPVAPWGWAGLLALWGCLGLDEIPRPMQTPHPEQLGPTAGSWETLELLSSKDLASQLTDHDWTLFSSVHQVCVDTGSCRRGEEGTLPSP